METSMDFKEIKGEWVATFTSSGNTVIELERKKAGVVAILASIGGLAEVPIAQIQNGYMPNVIFHVNVPSGVAVVVKSETEVLKAHMLVEG